MSSLAQSIVGPGKIVRSYAEATLKGVTPEQFARKPAGVDTNSPAWVFGHLAVYPDRSLFPLIGKANLAQPFDDFERLFGHKTTCQDDAAGAIYPPMEAITSRYFKRTDALLAAVAELGDAELAAPLPSDHFLVNRIANVAGVLNFMLGGHSMMHLGQVSAWRRMMGLGPCM